jgi:hypothetical protein
MKWKLDKKFVIKFRNIVLQGLCSGLGVTQQPGYVCIEQAVCLAMGLENVGDEPPCVAQEIRLGKMALNDKNWLSNKARAKGLLKVGIAQLGSKGIVDGKAFRRLFKRECVRLILVPHALELLAKDKELTKQARKDIKEALNSLKTKLTFTNQERLYNLVFEFGRNMRNEFEGVLDRIITASDSATHSDELIDIIMNSFNRYETPLYQKTLIKIADVMLFCLKKLKSPGCRYLYLAQK